MIQDVDGGTVVIENALGNREAKSRALANRLSGKKRIKQPISNILWYAVARIADTHDHLILLLGECHAQPPVRQRFNGINAIVD